MLAPRAPKLHQPETPFDGTRDAGPHSPARYGSGSLREPPLPSPRAAHRAETRAAGPRREGSDDRAEACGPASFNLLVASPAPSLGSFHSPSGRTHLGGPRSGGKGARGLRGEACAPDDLLWARSRQVPCSFPSRPLVAE